LLDECFSKTEPAYTIYACYSLLSNYLGVQFVIAGIATQPPFATRIISSVFSSHQRFPGLPKRYWVAAK